MSSRRRRSMSPIEERNTHGLQRNRTFDCRMCQKDHPLRKCIKFKRMNVHERCKVVKRYRYCENCLAHSHQMRKCRSTDRCRQCGDRHHTLLHRHKRLLAPAKEEPQAAVSVTGAGNTTVVPTAIIRVRFPKDWGSVRAILNPSATISSIARFLIDRFKLPVEVSGKEKWCTVSFRSRFNEGDVFHITAKVTDELPRHQPKKKLDNRVADSYSNLRLADPDFFTGAAINIVLGADIYPQLFRSGIQPHTVTTPMAQDTLLGWVIIGKFGL